MRGLISVDKIEDRIFQIRGKKVMLDKDLAQLYQVTTKAVNQAVKRNIGRFPEDFMFVLTEKEKEEVVTNCDHLKSLKFSHQRPYAFTEQGVAMLSGVLTGDRAVNVNIQIMRAFVNLRRMAVTYNGLKRKIDDLEKRYDSQFGIVFEAIRQLMAPPPEKPKPRIGFHP
jgi:chromosome condensin MukBEF ATPase and DNA-binding subunit MukB